MFTKRSNTIALFVPPESMHLNTRSASLDINLGAVIGGVEFELAKHSIYLTIASVTPEFLAKKEYLKFCRGKMVDGIIIWGWTEADSYLFELNKEQIPIAMVQSCSPELPLIQVVAQDYEGMWGIAEQIAACGHKHVAFIPPTLTSLVGRNRQKGFIDAAKKLGLDIYMTDIGGFDFDDGVQATLDILKHRPDITCIAASNDMAAWGAIETLNSQDFAVPGDISVTGADGLLLPGRSQLTTYISPSFDIGKKSAELILKQINKETNKTTTEALPVKFEQGTTLGKRH